MSAEPMTEERLKEIEGRAAECVRNAQEASPGVWTDSETVAGEDVPALAAEVRRLRGALTAIRDDARAKMGRARYLVDMTGFMGIGCRADEALGESEGT